MVLEEETLVYNLNASADPAGQKLIEVVSSLEHKATHVRIRKQNKMEISSEYNAEHSFK